MGQKCPELEEQFDAKYMMMGHSGKLPDDKDCINEIDDNLDFTDSPTETGSEEPSYDELTPFSAGLDLIGQNEPKCGMRNFETLPNR